MALIKLRETGRCVFEVPEALFDMDFPGHYFRRIKTVALSIPCVTGPYTGVNSRLTLTMSRIRIKPMGPYSYGGIEDQNFTHRFSGQHQAIVGRE